MKGSVLLFLMLWAFWILLSGFNLPDILVGGVVSAVISAIFGYFFLSEAKASYIRGFVFFLAYIPYYVFLETIDVLKVSYSILTGKIKPGVVEIPHSHMHEWGVTVLSNSITMTPGTLTLDADPERLFVHWLNMKGDKKNIVSRLDKVLKRIWD